MDAGDCGLVVGRPRTVSHVHLELCVRFVVAPSENPLGSSSALRSKPERRRWRRRGASSPRAFRAVTIGGSGGILGALVARRGEFGGPLLNVYVGVGRNCISVLIDLCVG